MKTQLIKMGEGNTNGWHNNVFLPVWEVVKKLPNVV